MDVRRKERNAIIKEAEEGQETESTTQVPPTLSRHHANSTDQGPMYSSPEEHYCISETTRDSINLISWVREHRDDNMYQVSYPAEVPALQYNKLRTVLHSKAERSVLDTFSGA